MKICVDSRPTQNVHAVRGIGTLVRNLVRELETATGRDELVYLVEPGRELPPAVEPRRALPCFRLPRLHHLNWIFNQLVVRQTLRHCGAGLFLATDFQSYVIPPAGVRQVALAYDLIPFLFPETMAEQPLLTRWGWRLNFRNLHRCRRIIAISESTRRDLISHLGLAPETVRVVYPGIDHDLFNMRNAACDIPSAFGIAGDYFLYVGDTEWRKNLRAVLEALAGIPGGVRLVIAGKRAPSDPRLRQWLAETGTADRVVLPGFVPDEDLPALYGHSSGFIFPTRYEGFGLPVAEAMACGCPVITSGNSSLPEVAGDAALYIDPDRPDQIRNAMLQLLQSHGLADDLRARGLEQVRRFTWEGFARGVRDVLSEAAAGTDEGRS